MDDQIDPGDNFFGINLSDCVTVAANLPSNAHTEPQDAPKRPFEHDPAVVTVTDEMIKAGKETPPAALASPMALAVVYRAMAAVAPQPQPIEWTKDLATGVMTPISIMDSVVGLKAANAHLTRQLAAQALAHAEQMEGLSQRKSGHSKLVYDKALRTIVTVTDPDWEPDHAIISRLRENERQCMARIAEFEGKIDCLMIECGALKREHDWERKARYEVENQLAAMRITPTTHPTDAQQTASDMKGAPERRPDGTLKPVAKAWEAPKRLTDVRRIGG